ncbi:MAG: hypothetical protein QXX74_03575, partial [Candidatus Micrarchaeaceae archaeon]
MILAAFTYIVSEISGLAASAALSAIVAERAFFPKNGRKARLSGDYAIGMVVLFAISLLAHIV